MKRLKDRHQKPVSKSCYKSLSEYKLIESSIADEASRYGIYSKDELKNDLFDVFGCCEELRADYEVVQREGEDDRREFGDVFFGPGIVGGRRRVASLAS